MGGNDYSGDLDYISSGRAMVGGTILRMSEAPVTPIDRNLPLNGAPGSLGYESV